MEMDWEIAQEARAKGYVLTREDGSPYEAILAGAPGKPVKIEHSLEAVERDDAWRDRYYRTNRVPLLLPDFTNPAVFQWWKEKVGSYVKAGCFGSGMSDFGEDIPVDAHYHNKRSGLEMHNMYQMLYQKATFEGIAENSDRRPLINARSGTAGMQKYPICWSGDPECEWEEMASTLRAGLSIGLSGVPFWSNDICRLSQNFGGLTPELYIRWMQMAMFQSHTRFNGFAAARAWAFGDRAVENYRKVRKTQIPTAAVHLFARLQCDQDRPADDPSHGARIPGRSQHAQSSGPVHVWRCFPGGSRVQANQQADRLSARRDVVRLRDGQGIHGPELRCASSRPLDVLPLYVRENSIIPMGPDMAYIGEKPFNPITLDIRLSSDAECTLYDDDERAHTQEIVKCQASRKGNQITLNMGASTKTYHREVQQDKPSETREPQRQGHAASRFTAGA